MARLHQSIWTAFMVIVAFTKAAPSPDPTHHGRYLTGMMVPVPAQPHQQQLSYYYPQQRWAFLPANLPGTRNFFFSTPTTTPAPCVPCTSKGVEIPPGFDEAGASLQPINRMLSFGTIPPANNNAGNIFDINNWLAMLWPQQGGQQPNSWWPFLPSKPCCPPTTTTPKPTTTTPKPTTTTPKPTTTTTITTTSPASSTTTTPVPSSTVTAPETSPTTSTTTTTTTTTTVPTTTPTVPTTTPEEPTVTTDATTEENTATEETPGESRSLSEDDPNAIPASGLKLIMNLFPPSTINFANYPSASLSQ